MPEPRTPQSPEPPSWSEWKAQHQQKPWYQRYPLAGEWLFEQANDRLHRLAFVEFLEHVGKFTVLIAVIVWVLEADNRAKERHYRAWELINSARGSTGDGGRRDALKDLNKDGISLAAAPLEGAWLQTVDLQGAYLQRANLEKANLREANLWGADLRGADLWKADLRRADLWEANLEKADLREANLGGANLAEANLQGADLREANLQRATLWKANLGEAEGLTQEQLASAFGDDKTLLPKHLTRPDHWISSKSEESAE